MGPQQQSQQSHQQQQQYRPLGSFSDSAFSTRTARQRTRSDTLPYTPSSASSSGRLPPPLHQPAANRAAARFQPPPSPPTPNLISHLFHQQEQHLISLEQHNVFLSRALSWHAQSADSLAPPGCRAGSISTRPIEEPFPWLMRPAAASWGDVEYARRVRGWCEALAEHLRVEECAMVAQIGAREQRVGGVAAAGAAEGGEAKDRQRHVSKATPVAAAAATEAQQASNKPKLDANEDTKPARQTEVAAAQHLDHLGKREPSSEQVAHPIQKPKKLKLRLERNDEVKKSV